MRDFASSYAYNAALGVALVGADLLLLIGGELAVFGDLVETQDLGERDFLGVAAREGRFDLRGHALAELLSSLEADLLQEGREKPAADAPRHPECAVELSRAPIEAAVDVDLLVHGGAVATVLLGRAVRGRFHGREDLAGEGAAADRVEGHGGAG